MIIIHRHHLYRHSTAYSGLWTVSCTRQCWQSRAASVPNTVRTTEHCIKRLLTCLLIIHTNLFHHHSNHHSRGGSEASCDHAVGQIPAGTDTNGSNQTDPRSSRHFESRESSSTRILTITDYPSILVNVFYRQIRSDRCSSRIT